jgi:hypothetical protein
MRDENMAQSNQGTASRPGLPAQSSVVSQSVLMPARRAATAGMPAVTTGKTYRILRTNEVDPYDAPMTHAQVPPLGEPAVPVSDDFRGTARKAAKLVIATAHAEPFGDLPDLLKTLPPKDKMTKHQPVITTDANSGRVAEENRNVRLRAFLYAASREADNDFHLIVGRDPNSAPHVYMTAEVSGLPPPGTASLAQLNAARDAYKAFFADKLPAGSYDFYDPPIPIEVEGSLFFDMTHATGPGPGPASLHKDVPTIWEIHPISNIVFEP